MATTILQTRPGGAWALANQQHGVVARRQLVALGLTRSAIRHRIETGRLHPVQQGVYAVGRPGLSREGRWMAATLAGGKGAQLSHLSGTALWGMGEWEAAIELTVPAGRVVESGALVVHRRKPSVLAEGTTHRGIPVTSVARTLLDIACVVRPWELEAAVNAADRLGLITPDALRDAVAERKGQPGVRPLRALLDRWFFVLTESELERRFLPLAERAGLGPPVTQASVAGFRADFFWPELGLVVETDGLRYHRTPAQQARDRVRDQAYAAAGLTCLRFTHAQVRYEPDTVVRVLRRVARRLRTQQPSV